MAWVLITPVVIAKSDTAMASMTSQTAQSIVKRNGKQFAIVEVNELRRLERLAAKAEADETELTPLPPADAEGNRPAVAFARGAQHSARAALPQV